MAEPNVLDATSHLVLQLALILFAAKLGAEIAERYARQPAVLGELLMGMVIGPYGIGHLLRVPGLPPGLDVLFPVPEVADPSTPAFIPVSIHLWTIAQIAVVILLFVAGLETDLGQFLRYGVPATIVAMGGVLLPFFLGDAATVLFGFAPHPLHPVALFMGAIMTATSVGITARILSDIGKIATPEGVTILGGAVVDDVIGILVLAIVVSISRGGAVSVGEIASLGFQAFGFWLGIMAAGILLAPLLARLLRFFRTDGAATALALALCFAVSAFTEIIGHLAMIIGAYVMGLSLSRTSIARPLVDSLRHVYHAFVPIFFVVMGMLVDFDTMRAALLFGATISVLAIIGKVVGCGLPALLVGFNRRGASRIGIGMLPRGEVALIVAGVGLATGAIDQTIFGVAIMMTFVTTLLAPILMVPFFRSGGPGTRSREPVEVGARG